MKAILEMFVYFMWDFSSGSLCKVKIIKLNAKYNIRYNRIKISFR